MLRVRRDLDRALRYSPAGREGGSAGGGTPDSCGRGSTTSAPSWDRIGIAGLVHVFEFRDECIESRIGPRRRRLGPIVFAGLETAVRMLVLLARAALPRDGPGCDGACIYSDEITLLPVLSDEDVEMLFVCRRRDWMER